MKGNKSNKAARDYDAKFEKYANMLPKEYKDQFKSNVKKPTQQQKVKDAVRTGKKVEIVSKNVGNKKGQISNVGKLLEEDIEMKTVPKEISIQVSKARNEHKLTQEQLANRISENVSKVKDLEAGNGIYDPKIVEKIEKSLNVKFTRPQKKNN